MCRREAAVPAAEAARVVYDAAGNITNDGLGHTYTYDGENHIIAVDGGTTATYMYDALGRRVEKTVAGSTISLVYDLQGRDVVEYSAVTDNRLEVYAPGNGRHLATYSDNLLFFEVQDQVGTERVKMTQDGLHSESTATLPFGDGQSNWGTDVGEVGPTHFTGLDLDSETNLTHAWFRQLSTTQGRWTSPDPAGMAAADPANPQSWNRYAYVGNNPLNATDPTGLVTCPACVGGSSGGDIPNLFYLGFQGASCVLDNPDGTETTMTMDGVDSPCGLIMGVMDTGDTGGGTVTTRRGTVPIGVRSNGYGGYDVWVDPGTTDAYDNRFGPSGPTRYFPGFFMAMDTWLNLMGGDAPIMNNIFSCADCKHIWKNAPSFVGVAYGGSVIVGAAVPLIPAAYGMAFDLSVTGYASAETAGIPITAGTAWVLSNSRTIQNWIRIGKWAWKNW